MWNWFKCYVSARHEYGVSCAPGTIFLRCVRCGRRSSGWSLAQSDAKNTRDARPVKSQTPSRPPERPRPAIVAVTMPQLTPDPPSARVLPFSREVNRDLFDPHRLTPRARPDHNSSSWRFRESPKRISNSNSTPVVRR
jgi:hypothetical protein